MIQKLNSLHNNLFFLNNFTSFLIHGFQLWIKNNHFVKQKINAIILNSVEEQNYIIV